MNEENSEDTKIGPDADTKHPAGRFTFSADTVKPMLALQVTSGKLREDESDLVWWFFSYCKSNSLTTKEAGRELGYDSGSTIYHLFNGSYGAKLDNIVNKIRKFKKLYEEREVYRNIDFVETSIAETVWSVCKAALVTQSIAYIVGDTQIGKSDALMEYARRNNHGQTKYIRMPASAGVQLFAKEVARACFVAPDTSFENLRDSIFKAIDNKTLVIIDEAHQAFLSYQKSSQIKVMEFIREIYDRRKCGMVLCGTQVLQEEVQSGKQARMLRQIDRRGIIRVQLPLIPPSADIEKIAAAFGLPPPTGAHAELVKDMIHSSGLGKFIKFLQAGASRAAKEKQKTTWDHVQISHDIIVRLSKPKEEKKS